MAPWFQNQNPRLSADTAVKYPYNQVVAFETSVWSSRDRTDETMNSTEDAGSYEYTAAMQASTSAIAKARGGTVECMAARPLQPAPKHGGKECPRGGQGLHHIHSSHPFVVGQNKSGLDEHSEAVGRQPQHVRIPSREGPRCDDRCVFVL